MANTYQALATVTVGSGGSSTIEFTSIPQTYTDLVLRLSARTDEAGQGRSYVRHRYNSSSAASYGYLWLFGYDGNTVVGNGDTALTAGHIIIVPAVDATANTFGNTELYIPNYTSTSKFKVHSSFHVAENNSSSIYMVGQSASLWSVTDAITSITLYAVNVGSSNKFVQHTTATLYGIKNS
jgi:hypothetical protein